MNKKILALLLSAAMLLSSGSLLYANAAEETDNESEKTTTIEGYDDVDATPSPDPDVTEQPSEAVDDDKPDAEDPEEDTDTLTPQFSGDIGASGGLGFFGSKFPDCRGHWAEKTIIECTDKHYLDGYDDGTFHPDDPVTAAEFSKIYSAWKSRFYTVNYGYWAMPFIRDMIDDGIFEKGDFYDYDAYMTREACAKAIIRSLKGEYFPSNLDMFREYITDIDSADKRYEEYVLKSYISGIITGYDDGSYAPKGFVTRAEILTLINRAINETERVIPEVAASDMLASETQTYYTAAVQVRRSTSANSMQFRLYGKNAQYMTEDDPSSGLKMVNEFQGAQGMAFLMRYDLTDILKREADLKSLKLVINYHSNGDMPLGLFWFEHKISNTDWNDSSYMQNINNSAVAGDNKAGYNAVCDNIKALLPTWGDIENAVPQEQKTQPFAQSELNTDTKKYVFDLSLDELKKHMDKNNIVEFFSTTVNYDRYGLDKDNKPRCYTAGEKAPQIFAEFNTGNGNSSAIRLLPDNAELYGGMLDFEGSDETRTISNFKSNQTIHYAFKAKSAGKYKLTVNYAANEGSGGGIAKIKVNDSETEHDFKQTGSWSAYVYEDLGTFELKEGDNILEISDKLIPNSFLINVRDVVFEKVD